MPAALTIDIWSDIACPWCWVGKRNLEAALAEHPEPVSIRWRAFELDPAARRSDGQPVDYVGRLAAKYRASRDQAQAMIDRMTRMGAEAGLEFRFDRVRPTSTFDAHRLLSWAAGHGDQTALKEQLFVAYMRDGKVISDHDVLAEAAAAAGLDADASRAILATDAHADEVRADERQAGAYGVTGVPFFLLDGRYAIPGAQPPLVMRQALDRATAARADDPPVDGAVCGSDGC